MVSTVIVASSFGIFVNSLLKDTKQAAVIFGGVLTVTGMLGLISVFTLNSPTARLTSIAGLVVPQGWAVRGLLQAMQAAAMRDVLLTVGMMLVWAVFFFAVGVWRFNKRYA
jgi:ABC-type multidrug transport system permease subunit